MTSTPSQIEWAERIKIQVGQEFDRVADALSVAALTQTDPDRQETASLVDLVAEKRAETLANEEAGYYIRVWQELDSQVRQMIAQDPRYQAILARRAGRKS